jgi:FkbM family methyltransferase
LWPLSKITAKTQCSNGTCFIELLDGTKFLGPKDKIKGYPTISHRIEKFKCLENCDSILELLGQVYLGKAYIKYYKPIPGDIVIDIGANIGAFTIQAAKLVGVSGKVIAIEPSTNTLQYLRKNVEINKLNNVVIVPKGVWSSSGKIRIDTSQNSTENSIYIRGHMKGEKRQFEEVEVDTLDNILRTLGVVRPNFIKIDIEGAEIDAIKGMDEVLANKTIIAAEHHIINGQHTIKTVVPQLRAKGFHIIKQGGYLYARN